MKKYFLPVLCVVTLLSACASSARADEKEAITLPVPKMTGGKPLMDTLKERKSMREFSAKELPLQVISDMLWAANGINRPSIAHKTAPSARNMQEIDIYVATKNALYLYDALNNKLIPLLNENIMAATGAQAFVEKAPVNLIFVADLTKMAGLEPAAQEFYSATDTGFISQNVYLFCASVGLATVVRGWVDKPLLAKAMKLQPDQMIVLAQTVGYPKDE